MDRLRIELLRKSQLIDPAIQERNAAWDQYRRALPGSAGIVDLISFSVMRRLGISDAFTNDQHFKAAGFNALF